MPDKSIIEKLQETVKCFKCGYSNIVEVNLTEQDVVRINNDGYDGYPLPDIFPVYVKYCGECGWVASQLTKSDKFNVVSNFNDPGDSRAPHYHKTGWHFEFVTFGKVEYFQRPLGSKEVPHSIILNVGQLLFIPPMVEHGLYFSGVGNLFTWANKGRPAGDLVKVEEDFLNPTEGKKYNRKSSYGKKNIEEE